MGSAGSRQTAQVEHQLTARPSECRGHRVAAVGITNYWSLTPGGADRPPTRQELGSSQSDARMCLSGSPFPHEISPVPGMLAGRAVRAPSWFPAGSQRGCGGLWVCGRPVPSTSSRGCLLPGSWPSRLGGGGGQGAVSPRACVCPCVSVCAHACVCVCTRMCACVCPPVPVRLCACAYRGVCACGLSCC